MIGAQFSDGLVRYAQLVDYQGLPYIEALGNFKTQVDFNPNRWLRTNIRYEITEMVETIKNKIDFPDRQAIAVVETNLFPHRYQKIDFELPSEDRLKLLNWQFQEAFDLNPENFKMVHQRLYGVEEPNFLHFFTIAIPVEFRQTFQTAFDKAGLALSRVDLDSLAAIDMLSYAGHMRHLDQILMVGCDGIQYHLLLVVQGELIATADFSIGANSEIGIDVVRGEWPDLKRIVNFLHGLLKGNPRRSSPVDHTFLYGRPLELDRWERLLKGPEITLFNPTQAFHLRDTKVLNASQYVELLGSISRMIRERFDEN